MKTLQDVKKKNERLIIVFLLFIVVVVMSLGSVVIAGMFAIDTAQQRSYCIHAANNTKVNDNGEWKTKKELESEIADCRKKYQTLPEKLFG